MTIEIYISKTNKFLKSHGELLMLTFANFTVMQLLNISELNVEINDRSAK